MALNTRQANFLAKVKSQCRIAKDLYEELLSLKESFTEEFASTQDNDLEAIEHSTTVDADSASGQVALNVASTVGFKLEDNIVIDKGGDKEEFATIETIGDGVLNLTSNLIYTHTAVDADTVATVGDLCALGLSYSAIATACNQFMNQYVNFWEGSAVATREYGKDARRVANNE